MSTVRSTTFHAERRYDPESIIMPLFTTWTKNSKVKAIVVKTLIESRTAKLSAGGGRSREGGSMARAAHEMRMMMRMHTVNHVLSAEVWQNTRTGLFRLKSISVRGGVGSSIRAEDAYIDGIVRWRCSTFAWLCCHAADCVNRSPAKSIRSRSSPFSFIKSSGSRLPFLTSSAGSRYCILSLPLLTTSARLQNASRTGGGILLKH
mmetsp:Transcript_23774/g.58736  ORF Transcript_23774/g.58736 Transcript_23774/m.58736 type:complete len:205 (-) Transcript_23774:833-1447(-)